VLQEKAEEAVALLNLVDSQIADNNTKKPANMRGKCSLLGKMDDLFDKKQAVAYMLKFSADNRRQARSPPHQVTLHKACYFQFTVKAE
jgi:hypothetical protein